jgi:hypothetical protein
MANNPNCLSSTPLLGIPMIPDTGYPIYIGDLLFQDPTSKHARSAASMADQGTALLDQETFAGLFAGVALQRGGELNPANLNPEPQGGAEVSFNLNPLPPQLIVAADGDFLFACAATTWYPGDLVAIAAASPGGCSPQTVVKTTNKAAAIGYAAPLPNAIGQSRTQVAVRIKSALTGGFPSGQAEPSSSGTP